MGHILSREAHIPRSRYASVDLFNLFDAKDSDVDYYYASRLPNERLASANDIHLHPTLPRTGRLNLVIGF
jgi:hypothetical protein